MQNLSLDLDACYDADRYPEESSQPHRWNQKSVFVEIPSVRIRFDHDRTFSGALNLGFRLWQAGPRNAIPRYSLHEALKSRAGTQMERQTTAFIQSDYA